MIRNKKMSIKKVNKDILEKLSLENIRDFVDKYLIQIMYIVVIILFVSLVTVLIINNKKIKYEKNIISFYQAIDYISKGKNEESLNILNNLYTSSNNKKIKTISGIKMADILLKDKKYDEALKIYLDIYKLKENNNFLRNLSGIAALNILISQNNQKNYIQIENLIKKLSNPKNPLLSLVQEQEAWFELQKGNKQQGLDILYNLLKQEIDQDTKNRVDTVIKAYENENI